MAHIKAKKRGKLTYYYVAYTTKIEGKSQKESLYVGRDREAAEIKLREVEIGQIKNTPPIKEKVLNPGSRTLENLVSAYFEYAKGHLSQTTHTRYQYYLRDFVEFAGASMGISKIKLPMVESYKHHQLKSKALRTVRDDIATLSTFFTFLINFGYVDKNPVKDVKLPKLARGTIPDHLTKEEVKTLVRLAESMPDPFYAQRNTVIVETLARTGLRATELCNLKWKDIDFKMRKIFVHEGKGKKSRVVPLSDKLTELLQVFPNGSEHVFTCKKGKPINRNTLRLLFDRLQSKFPSQRRIYCHLLRHTFASLLAQDGVSIYKIQRYMGHSDVSTTTNSYAALSPESLQDDINRVDF